jgi:large subunit ribosomal protein L21
MTYAIVETGGKQLWAEPGQFYDVELLSDEPDSLVELSNVLLVQHDGDVTVGQPYIDGAVVKARVLLHRRGPKVVVYKMRPKKKTRKKTGHRQSLTRLLIESIELKGNTLAEVSTTSVPQAAMSTAATNSDGGDGAAEADD